MKPYIRRMFGDEMVDRHRAMKQQLDPAFILNPGRGLRCARRPGDETDD